MLYRRRVDSDTTGVVATVVGESTTTEAAGKATISVKLSSRPVAPEVIVSITSSDPTEGKPDVAKLTFTSANWQDNQTVSITGQNDQDPDSDVEYTVRFEPKSLDSLYNVTGGVEISLINTDNEAAVQPPFITRQPKSQTVTVGGTASFEVEVSGGGDLRFRWIFDGRLINGQTSATISLKNVQPELAGSYSVAISNGSGKIVTSSRAILTVKPAPVATADLSPAYDSSPTAGFAGQELIYGLVIRNTGPDQASSVTVSVDIPGSVAFVSAEPDQGTCTESDGTLTCSLGEMQLNGGATVTVVLITPSEGQVAHSATVFSAEVDPSSSNNFVSATTDVARPVAGVSTPTPAPTRTPAPTATPTPVPAKTPDITPAPTPVPAGPPAAAAATPAPLPRRSPLGLRPQWLRRQSKPRRRQRPLR